MSSEGTLYKAVSLDMIVLSSLSLGLWRKLFTRNCSALFFEAAWGSCSQHALSIQENCHGAVGWNSESCFSFYNRTELCVFLKLLVKSSKRKGTVV